MERRAEAKAESKAEAKRRALVAKLTGKGFDLSLVEAAMGKASRSQSFAGLPLPVLPDVGGGASQVADLVNEVCTAMDKDLSGAVKKALGSAEDALKASRAVEAKTAAKVTKATGPAYHKLKALLEKEHPSWRASLSAAPVPNAAGQVGWVTNENAAAWQARSF